jgi:MFS family permease
MTTSKTSTFRRTLPLLITHFVNQAGDIGLSLLPMLLVARAMTPESSALVMTLVKTCVVLGIFLGGWSSDHIGLRTTLLLSFLIAALGMGVLPFSTTLSAIAVAASLAQLGQGMFQSPARMFLSELVPAKQRQESLAWLRVANNAGAVFIYLLGALASGAGFVFLMLFDCGTSLAAALAGFKILPHLERSGSHLPPGAAATSQSRGQVRGGSYWPPFLVCAFTLSGYSFLYNFIYVSLAARMQLQLGTNGVTHFARLMLLGTTMCALLSVPAARVVRSRRAGLLAGVIFVALGSTLVLTEQSSTLDLYLGIGILTLGEIVFNAVAHPALIELTPASAKPGRAHAIGLVIQSIGRALGAALAFPLAVYGNYWLSTIAVATTVTLLLSLRVPREKHGLIFSNAAEL